MEAYLFIYSRLERFDYRLIYAPSQSFLPNPTRNEFISFTREVINTDNISNGKINATRWSLIRRGQKVLFGVGIYNKDLGDCSSDIETRNVRGFFGFVFNFEKGTLPEEYFTLSFFQNLYSSYIMPLWHAGKKNENRINSIIQKIDVNIKEYRIDSFLELNTYSTTCKVLPEAVVISDAINSALNVNDIEIVLGLNNIKHVTSAPLLQFRNISIIGNLTEENIPISQNKSQDSPFKSEVSTSNTSVQSRGRRTIIEDKSRYTTTKSEYSDYEYLAELLYAKLKRCGINVKRVVANLAKKCGLCIIEQPIQGSFNQTFENNEKTNVYSQNEIADSQNDLAQATINKEKAERRARFAEIRKKLSTSDEVSEDHRSSASPADLHPEVNNIEELINLTPGNKDNLDIEDLK